MTNLRQIQSDFLAFLQTGAPDIHKHVVGTAKVNIDTRLGIYANAYRYRLLEAMQDTFPAVHTLLGDERFENAVFRYIDQHPSEHFSIRYFGHQFGEFLSADPLGQEQPIIAEMAQFEWVLRDAFDAQDADCITLETLQQIPADHWPGMHFQPHPSLSRIDLQWNTAQLWQAVENEEEPIPAEINPHPVGWVIWRQDMRTYFRSMEIDESWALDATLAKHDFGSICEGLCQWIDEIHAAPRAAGFLSDWVNNGMISQVNAGQ